MNLEDNIYPPVWLFIQESEKDFGSFFHIKINNVKIIKL